MHRVRAWAQRHQQGLYDVELTLALLVLAELLPAYRTYPNDQVGRAYGGLISILALPQILPLALRRKAPLVTLVLMVIGSFAPIFIWGWQAEPGIGSMLAITAGIYTVAAHRPRPISLAVLTVWLFLILFLLAYGPFSQWFSDMLPSFVIWIAFPSAAAWISGDYLQRQRARRNELAARAAQEELRREEFARAAIAEERARQAASEERARIARELHDVVAHSMSVMVVQAGAARRILKEDPAEATRSISSIEDTGREALTEMRRLLGVVRNQGAEGPELMPQPGVDQLQPLVEKVTEAGVAVEMQLHGTPRPLSPGVALSCYRVVQEALTNTLKHSQAKHARVELLYRADALQVRVTDDGHGQRDISGRGGESGFGLIGLRERVSVFGGTFESGNLPGSGGYFVTATLPLTSR